MSGLRDGDRSAAIAAFVILTTACLGFFFMPSIVLALAEISPWVAAAAAAIFVAGFFVVFWLRAKAQRRAEGRAGDAPEADGAAPLVASALVLVWFLGLLVVPGFVSGLNLPGGLRTALIAAYVLMLLPGLWLLTRLRR